MVVSPMKMRSLLSLAMFFVAVVPALAEESKEEKKAAKKITFEEHVKPIFRDKCLSCHNMSDAKGGLALDSFSALMQGGGSGEVVYEGDAEGSRLWQLVAHEDTPVMPPNQDRIPDEQVELIRAWIAGGMLENSSSKVKKKKNNALAFAATTSGKPEGPAAMPETVLQQPAIVTDRPSASTAIAASPWAPLVAIGGQEQIVLYNTDSGEFAGVMPFPEGMIYSLRFSRDGAFIIAGGGEGARLGIVAVYDVKTGDRLATVGDELDVVFGSDVNDRMTRIALGGPQRMLRIFDAGDGELLFDIKKHTDWIYDVAYSPDGVLLASCDRSAGLLVWEAETGREYLNLTDHKDAINALAWRDDSNVLASASDDGTVKLWEMLNGKAIRSINAHGGGVVDVAFDHKGQLVTCGKDRRVKLWDASGKMIREFPPMAEQVLEVTISHDSTKVVAGDWTGTTKMWSVEDPKNNEQALASNPPTLETRIAAAEAAAGKLAAPVQEAEQKLAAVQAKQKELGDRKAGLEAKRQQMIAQADAKKQQLQKVEQAVADLTKQRDQVAADAASKRQAVEAARAELQKNPAVEAKVANVEKTLAESLTRLVEKRSAIVERRKELKPLQDAENGLRKQAEQIAPQMQKVAEQMTAMDKQVAEATAAVKSAQQSHQAAVAKVQELKQDLQQFRQRLDELAKAASIEPADESSERLKTQATLVSTAYQD